MAASIIRESQEREKDKVMVKESREREKGELKQRQSAGRWRRKKAR